MEPNVQNSSGMMNGMPPQAPHEKKVGPIVGTLIIVLVLIVAALYFINQRLNTNEPAANTTVQQDTTSQTSASHETINPAAQNGNLSSSDDVDSIQADLGAQAKDIDYSF